MDAVLWFHQNWFYVSVISTGVIGLWGVGLAVLKKPPGRAFGVSVAVAIGVMLVQVVAGVALYASGLRPGDGFHVFYGVVIAVTLSIAYVYRAQLAKRPALAYGLLLLFVMGLGLRAWANVN
jgi:hypothetical protein